MQSTIPIGILDLTWEGVMEKRHYPSLAMSKVVCVLLHARILAHSFAHKVHHTHTS